MKSIFLSFFLLSTQLHAHTVLGILKGEREIMIKTKSQGQLKKILIKEGEKVSAGETIAQLENEKEKIDYNLAKAEYEAAQKALNDSKKLKKYLSKDELAKKKTDYLRRKATLEQRRISLENKSLISPINGIVAKKFVRLDAHIGTGADAYEVIKMDKLNIELDIEAKHTQALSKGSELEFSSELHPDRTFKANVYYIGKVLDKASGTISVKLALDNLKDENEFVLKPGTMVKVSVNSK